MRGAPNRQLDPALLTPDERAVLDRLSLAVHEAERPYLVGGEGDRIDLPEPIYQLLVETIAILLRGQKAVLMPEHGSVTTQAASEMLGVSRPFLVNLLTSGAIPYHRVGKHRRIAIWDLMEYASRRDLGRRKILDELSDRIDSAGMYDAVE